MVRDERLTAVDAAFVALEDGVTHMHVGACAVFDGPAPAYADLVELVDSRLAAVPRYRQRLAFVPFGQGRPVWVDDPQFRLPFHIRHTALPHPGSDEQLRRLVGRLFSQQLDRGRPLWEMWLAEGLEDDHFAIIFKTHHAVIDGVGGVDLASVLFDGGAAQAQLNHPWLPRPLPTRAQLLADALLERATAPREPLRAAAGLLRPPRALAVGLRDTLTGAGALAWAGLQPAPRTPLNVPIGPHRRFTWVRSSLEDLRSVKASLGGTVNDAVLTAVAGALGRHLRRHAHATDGLVLKALVPVSVRAPESSAPQPSLGNQVAAMWAPLPVGVVDPAECLKLISASTDGAKRSRQSVGARALTELAGFASPTLIAQAARLQARQRLFNLVVTNVPGPQHPMHFMGRRLTAIYPLVPLAANTSLGVAVISYDGALDFGLCADYDALPDLDALAEDLRAALSELLAAAHARPSSSA